MSKTRHSKNREERLNNKRRMFLTTLVTMGGVATAASFAPWTQFLWDSIVKGGDLIRDKIRFADGRTANINNVPLNSASTFVYPRIGDPVADAEPFRRFQLIRLHKDLGGDKESPSAFRAYSMICVHLWCLWNYYSDRRLMNATVDGTIECPCHGSKYDPNNGLAVAGPAAMQTEPNNALPRLDIEIEDNGDLMVVPPTWTVTRNGVIGFGRYV